MSTLFQNFRFQPFSVLRKPSKQVAVVVPLSTHPDLTPDEETSLRHLRHHLGDYDKFMVLPESLPDVAHDGFTMLPFDNSFFGSIHAHNNLLVSPEFYKTFADYEYILIYHLDALVLSDQLTEWCGRGLDYMAPPWIPYEGAPYQGVDCEGHIGNGGFSLRNVRSFRRILRKIRYPAFTKTYARRILRRAKKIENRRNEDVFWGMLAPQIDASFRVADLDTALQFAFECNPRLCFEKNNQQLPFGCHAFMRYDADFWKPHLLPK